MATAGSAAVTIRASAATPPWRRCVVAGLLLALLSMGATARAAPFTLTTNGSLPDAAVDAAGTGHFAWTERVPGGDVLHYCQVPRGQTVCTALQSLTPPAPDPTENRDAKGPHVFLPGPGRVVLVTHRCCGRMQTPDGKTSDEITWTYTSTDGGVTFGAPRIIGSGGGDVRWEAAYGPGATILTVTQFGTFQAEPLTGFVSATAQLSPTFADDFSVASLDPQTPVVAYYVPGPVGTGTIQFRRYTGTGDVNDAANWSPAVVVDSGSQGDSHIVDGPHGVYLMYVLLGSGGRQYVIRHYDGTAFGPATPVSEQGDPIFADLAQDATGTLHAAWRDGNRALMYSDSTDGSHWSAPVNLANPDPSNRGGYDTEVAAVKAGDGFAVSDSNVSNSVIEAAPLGEPVAGGGPPGPGGCTAKVSFRSVEAVFPEGRCFQKVGDAYVASAPIRVNGLDVTPETGAQVALNPVTNTISSHGPVRVTAGSVALVHGPLNWSVPDGPGGVQIADVDAGSLGGNLFGFPIKGTAHVSFAGGTASVQATAGLPAVFGGLTGDVSLSTDNAVGLRIDGLVIKVTDAFLGALEVKDLAIQYTSAGGAWTGSATLVLPPGGASLSAGFGLHSDALDYARADLSFGSPGLAIAPAVFLNRINFSISTHPTTLSGGVMLSAGPTVLGLAAASVDGNLSFMFPDDSHGQAEPAVLKAHGQASVVSIPMATADAEYRTTGYLRVSGDFHLLFFNASILGFVDPSGFDFEGTARNICLLPGICVDLTGVISNVGVAVCGSYTPLPFISLLTWSVGIGYRWGDGLPSIQPYGCDVTPYRNVDLAAASRRAAYAHLAATSVPVALPGGLPKAQIAVVGSTGSPKVTVTGPGGVSIASAPGAKPAVTHRSIVLEDPANRTTYVIIVKPAAGTYAVTTQPGSSPIAQVMAADGLPPVRVSARVGHRRGAWSLTYTVKPIPGQVVRFAERSADTGRMLGLARGSSGTLAFTPADGHAGRRQIIAMIEQNGLVRAQPVVATYVAPGPVLPPRPPGLGVTRRGGGLTMRWRVAAGAVRYKVVLALSDGRRLLLAPVRGALTATLPALPTTTLGTVAVTGLRADGLAGRAAIAAIPGPPHPVKPAAKPKKSQKHKPGPPAHRGGRRPR